MVGLPGWGLHSSLASWPSRPLGVWPGWKPAPGLAPELGLVWPEGSPRAWLRTQTLAPWVTELIRMTSGGDLSSAGGGPPRSRRPLENHLMWKSVPGKPLS